MELSEKAFRALKSCVGAYDSDNPGYRNYYVIRDYDVNSDHHKHIFELEDKGLFFIGDKQGEGLTYFHATDMGKQLAIGSYSKMLKERNKYRSFIKELENYFDEENVMHKSDFVEWIGGLGVNHE